MKKIRLATKEDAKEILDIYAPYIINTAISFEQVVPTLEEFEQRILDTVDLFPYLVYEEDGEILGYAYAGKHAVRHSYLYSVNVSVYVSENHQGKNIGKVLYTRLFEILTQQGYYTAFSAITSENEKSIAVHKKMGFEQVGYFKNAGYKFNRWLSLVWLQKELNDYNGEIGRIKVMEEIDFFEEIL